MSTDDDETQSDIDETQIVVDLPVFEQQADIPAAIELNSIVTDIEFHPQKDMIAAGTIDGPVKIYSYTVEKSRSNHKLMTFKHHKTSCRSVRFSHSGEHLFTGSSDATSQVVDLNTGKVTQKLVFEGGDAIYCLLPIDNYLLATGDDSGNLILWDFRRQEPAMTFDPSSEYVSSLTMNSEKRILLATCGDGSLSVFNVRSRKLEQQSEVFNDEFLTAAIMKNESKVIVGASDGALNIFNWGEWGNISDRFPGHPDAIHTMVKVNDKILCTGCDDGQIRAVGIFPNKFLGVIGNRKDITIDDLSISHDGKFLASCSYNPNILFHDLAPLENILHDDEIKPKADTKNRQLNAGDDFFAGLA